MPPFEQVEQPIRTRLALIELQLKRVASDVDSEKRTRAAAHTLINDKLDKQGSMLFTGLGIMLVLQLGVGAVLVNYFAK